MSETHTARGGSGAILREDGTAATTGAANLLYLSAAPTFAIMALLTGWWRITGRVVFERGCIAAERNGADVPADERFPHGALAEADLPSARRHASVS
jgi:hypothetical protein